MKFKRMINVVGAHVAGERNDVITGGVLDVPGNTMFDKMKYLETQGDDLRKFLLQEPRGTVTQCINLVLPSSHPEADAGFVIMESEFYPPMSGSNTICTVTALLETGMIAMVEPVTRLTLEAPGGLVRVEARCQDGKCLSVKFTNVPCFVFALDKHIEVPGLGTLKVDVAYGGMIYVLADAQSLGFDITPDEAATLVSVGETIKAAAAEQIPAIHPEQPEIHTINQTLFAGPMRDDPQGKRSRNGVIVSPGRLDRSPCGTGTSARLAVMHARGQIKPGEKLIHESILSTEFVGEIVETLTVGDRAGIRPAISGQAFLTGFHQYVLDPNDPFPTGYTLSDTWRKNS
ncbi:proline racemase family protein [Pseudomonas gingeri]|uniref:Proline racemase family protein n=1 Tax=Pseudomonas gingeri TaxID=117681 RepID=A0A7Y7YFU0_9PSED|nr:proline racemase family protein [Pseudomonas gingeri]NWB31411.1 proline racemase family protein [Pseudomonas gingeri]NWC35724.1 proline racemase family protein [Pseudomonas gingeri]NWD49425.1 proline racemase family protein [Pseudomonas gingeri]NWE26433.1 proline racemase family protein [Pseudomonas gingeri]NWE97438.1 proline racemase family protein [Pseudomonas gingeri]